MIQLMFMLAICASASFMLGFILILLASTLSLKSKMDLEKKSPFECGFTPKANSRFFFSLQFFLVTLIFLIFDIELILMFPILGFFIFTTSFFSAVSLLVFVMVLSAGLAWEWSQSILEWTSY